VNELAVWHLSVDDIQEADELVILLALHAVVDGGTFGDF
jgi:hypothetical protein